MQRTHVLSWRPCLTVSVRRTRREILWCRYGAIVATSSPSIHRSSQNKAFRPSPSLVKVDALKKAWTSLEVWIGSWFHARS